MSAKTRLWACSCELLEVDCSAAGRRAAGAGHADGSLREFVVYGQFLAFSDSPPAEIQDVPADSSSTKIRIAAVVDQLGAAASDGSVDHPASLQVKETEPLRFAGPHHSPEPFIGFALRDTFSRVLDHFAAWRDGFGGEYSQPLNARRTDLQPPRMVARIKRWMVCGVSPHGQACNKDKRGCRLDCSPAQTETLDALEGAAESGWTVPTSSSVRSMSSSFRVSFPFSIPCWTSWLPCDSPFSQSPCAGGRHNDGAIVAPNIDHVPFFRYHLLNVEGRRNACRTWCRAGVELFTKS